MSDATEWADENSTDVVLIPAEWRVTCSACGRFVSSARCGTVYAPYGDRLQYDGYQDIVDCNRCGVQEMGFAVIRWERSRSPQ